MVTIIAPKLVQENFIAVAKALLRQATGQQFISQQLKLLPAVTGGNPNIINTQTLNGTPVMISSSSPESLRFLGIDLRQPWTREVIVTAIPNGAQMYMWGQRPARSLSNWFPETPIFTMPQESFSRFFTPIGMY